MTLNNGYKSRIHARRRHRRLFVFYIAYGRVLSVYKFRTHVLSGIARIRDGNVYLSRAKPAPVLLSVGQMIGMHAGAGRYPCKTTSGRELHSHRVCTAYELRTMLCIY